MNRVNDTLVLSMWAKKLLAEADREPFFAMFPVTPLTRWQRIKARLSNLKNRFARAWDALVHDE